MSEAFQPVAIRPPSENRLLFAVRCCIDLQLLTVFRFLRAELPACRGRVLDVGAGEAPWRELLAEAEYVGLDLDAAGQFGMRRQAGIVYYDGRRMPFADGAFDHVLCAEVLEHVPDPRALLLEAARVLRRGGSLILTVPWSARLHHLPHDYHRFTRYGLEALLGSAGFSAVRIEERGNDVAVVANKLVVMTVGLLLPRRGAERLWTWPLALPVGLVALGFVLAAHLAIAWHRGSREDPLGYSVVALKR